VTQQREREVIKDATSMTGATPSVKVRIGGSLRKSPEPGE
jgi:hypothetical protein